MKPKYDCSAEGELDRKTMGLNSVLSFNSEETEFLQL
jgi:hypothetical protein